MTAPSDPAALVAELRAGKVGPLPDGWDMGHYEEAVQRLLDRAADLIAQQAATIAAAADEIERLKILVAGSEAERYRVCGELVTRTTTAESERDELLREKERLGGAMNALKAVRPVIAGLISAEYNVETWGLKGRMAAIDAAMTPNHVCEVCGGDCSAANPPPTYCPDRDGSGPNLADAHSKSPAPSSQSERIAVLERELGWYGEQARLARLIHSEGDAGRHALAADGGKRARAALAPLGEE